ncbi:MAG: hypothetical protein J5814_01090 [Bacteroidaceae bacterium]|nr:hypothetical protein [Bacteroidaceae bacterium]
MSSKKETNQKQSKKRLRISDIINGDVLTQPFVRRQMGLIVLIMVLIVLYEGNRYACQKDIVAIQRARKELLDLRNESVALNNELMQKSRQSNIEQRVANTSSNLKPSTAAPVVIERK